MKMSRYFVITGTMGDIWTTVWIGWIEETWNKDDFLKEMPEDFYFLSVKELSKEDYYKWREE